MSKGCILITEDNPSNMKLIRDILNYHGYDILCAENGKMATELIKNNKTRIDLILMDLQLPDMNGLDIVKLVKSDKTTLHIPVFIVSAYAMENDIQKAFEAGCTSYITKPINIESFIKKINEFFENIKGNKC